MLLSIKLSNIIFLQLISNLTSKGKNVKALLQKNGFIHYQSDIEYSNEDY